MDDLSRNFELNKKNGLVVLPFYLNPADAAAAIASGAGPPRSDASFTLGLPPPPGSTLNPADDDELRVLADYLSSVAKVEDFNSLDHSVWKVKTLKAGAMAR